MKPIITLMLVCLGAFSTFAAATYREPWRPQFHFTPATNWMNDPNGMVFYDVEYHLFYQFNPFGNKWGHMSWGHAVSKDLVRWEHLPIALYEESDVMIFSGSAVVDWKNTSGFGSLRTANSKPPLVAIYTGHYTKKPLQNQHIAYSNDRGRTWTKFSGNPVLDIGEKDFRDPKVRWHEPTKRWVMTVAWPRQHKVRFYASLNLKDWTHLSDFGPAGATSGIWECPDLFPLRVEGSRKEQWVLIVNLNPGGPAGGSACQYFIGEFDGKEFALDSSYPKPQPKLAPEGKVLTDSEGAATSPALWADYGADFYAAVSWSDIPQRDGRRLWLGWMSDWRYANDVPTSPWRSAMTIPRELRLRQTPNGLRMFQHPVRELEKLRDKRHRLGRSSLGEANEWLAKQKLGALLEIKCEFELRQPTDDIALTISTGANEETVLRRTADGRLVLDRTRSGKTDFSRAFPAAHSAPLASRDALSLHLFLDTSSLEVFADDGATVLTDLVFPTGAERKLTLASEKSPRVRRFEVWELNSAWR